MIEVVYAIDTFPVQIATGARTTVAKGTHWPADDPIVLANQRMFSPDPRYGLIFSTEPDGWDAPVETATAVPGERRNARRG